MKIITAWKLEPGDESPWLVSAYDEVTEMEHGGTPAWYLEAVQKVQEPIASGTVLRELVIDVADEALDALFTVPEVKATGL